MARNNFIREADEVTIASITKLMTAIVLENYNLDDLIQISASLSLLMEMREIYKLEKL